MESMIVKECHMKNLKKKIVPLITYRQKWDDNIKIDVESI